METTKHLIYGLLDPRTNVLRYVGKSSQGLKRARTHFYPSVLKKDRTRCGNWVKSLISQGMVPIIQILEESSAEKSNLDERFWIASLRASGALLLNHTEGGEGTLGRPMSASVKKKLSLVNLGNKNAFGTKRSPETIALLRHRAINRPAMSEGVRKQISQTLTGRIQNPDIVRKRSESLNLSGALNKPVKDSLGNVFKSSKAAATTHKLSRSRVCTLLKTGKFTRNGIGFQYMETN